MEFGHIDTAGHSLDSTISEIARSCGRFAIECSDVGGKVAGVADKIVAQTDLLGQLRQAATELLGEQEHVTSAAAEAREYAGQARDHLQRSTPAVDAAIATFGGLTDLVLRLGARMDKLEEALHQVQGVVQTINQIGRQTNLLALNATLEAARAGPAGRGFGVVAGEVKKLASDSRHATQQITRTLEQLSMEAKGISDEIDAGVASGGEARARTAELSLVLGETLTFVNALDTHSDAIAEGSLAIRRNVQDLQLGLTVISSEAQINSGALGEASDRLNQLESTSNALLNLVSHSGVATADTPFIERARRMAVEIRQAIETAIDDGRLATGDVFDTGYVPIMGSDPVQYMNRFVAFADAHVRPILDRGIAADRRGLATAIVDMNGFLPTHISSRSLPQGPDPLWNAEHCRNRRIFIDDQTAANLASDSPFTVETYRQDLGGGRYRPVKSVSLPLRIKGQRWGNLEFAYLD